MLNRSASTRKTSFKATFKPRKRLLSQFFKIILHNNIGQAIKGECVTPFIFVSVNPEGSISMQTSVRCELVGQAAASLLATVCHRLQPQTGFMNSASVGALRELFYDTLAMCK
eukprot:TRINITY_DN37518_c0_g1_i1.p1 TRINITY_DN37518_c0_g1~~TRINITY_DN37518_c0_g1_i1.p1  ORF type:complete len:113 (-),score=1.70 TRINITY_DN37518_c0_g1_i1:577-915(-)